MTADTSCLKLVCSPKANQNKSNDAVSRTRACLLLLMAKVRHLECRVEIRIHNDKKNIVPVEQIHIGFENSRRSGPEAF